MFSINNYSIMEKDCQVFLKAGHTPGGNAALHFIKMSRLPLIGCLLKLYTNKHKLSIYLYSNIADVFVV